MILVGGPFIADTGEHLDSRQPWADDWRSYMARDALNGSEIWWRTVASLVFPLLDAEGGDNSALIYAARMVLTANPDGSIQRRRLTSVLPGGFRSATNGVGRWRYPEVGPGGPSESGGQGQETTRIIVTANGFSLKSSYPEFEREWLEKGNVIIVVPHTYATSLYLDGYVEWVADGRPDNVPGPLFPRGVYDGLPLPEVVPIEADFGVTGVLQGENWVDPAPLEAARFLLQARFDLKLGIWDLVTNDILRLTLLKELPIKPPSSTPAEKPAGTIERHEALRARRRGAQKNARTIHEEAATLVASLDAVGWTSSLPGVLADDAYRRTVPIAFAPECDDAEARARHPSIRPGKTVVWLQYVIRMDSPGDSKVELVIPAPLSLLRGKIFDPFFKERLPELESIAKPNYVINRRDKRSRSRRQTSVTPVDDGKTISYVIMEYDRLAEIRAYKVTGEVMDMAWIAAAYKAMDKKIWWAQRVAAVAERTPAWINVFSPLEKQCRDAIAENPRLGRS
ncbi:hypothetical protein [Mycobacterium mantenii]|uniref:hypothetical protein n=1 Tax=Mycobacterium mantenii TaxID=560555 RepID=UPI0010428276|nr:hypothetical protein [Mycobacterium mantenii]